MYKRQTTNLNRSLREKINQVKVKHNNEPFFCSADDLARFNKSEIAYLLTKGLVSGSVYEKYLARS